MPPFEKTGLTPGDVDTKVVISCVNPLGFHKRGPYGLDLGATSAAESAQGLLEDAIRVGAFDHISAVSLISEAAVLDHEDVLVCGDDAEAKAAVIELARTITGRRGYRHRRPPPGPSVRTAHGRVDLDHQALQGPLRSGRGRAPSLTTPPHMFVGPRG